MGFQYETRTVTKPREESKLVGATCDLCGHGFTIGPIVGPDDVVVVTETHFWIQAELVEIQTPGVARARDYITHYHIMACVPCARDRLKLVEVRAQKFPDLPPSPIL